MIGRESNVINDEANDPGPAESGLEEEPVMAAASAETESVTNILGVPAFPRYMESSAEKSLD